MKTNNYLSLCLEQAALSPLHYRHGCIIVRGGKVIGVGYNDHRKGFDGGALKSGCIASVSLDGPAIADLKRKRKLKQKPDLSSKHDDGASTKPFVPYEGMGRGHHANAPLSMHSEMMAIHSAIARSSTLAATAMSSVKPSFKLPGSSKRKARLRHETLKAYVELVCCAALEQQQGKQLSTAQRRESRSSVQEWRFEPFASQPGQVGGDQEQGSQGQGVRAGQYEQAPSEEREESSPDESEGVSVSVRPF
jgi:deoxycytidylate deaminase